MKKIITGLIILVIIVGCFLLYNWRKDSNSNDDLIKVSLADATITWWSFSFKKNTWIYINLLVDLSFRFSSTFSKTFCFMISL